MATIQDAINQARNQGYSEAEIKKKVESIGGNYTPPSSMNVGVTGPENLIAQSNLPKPGFFKSVGNFLAPTTTANIQDISAGLKTGSFVKNKDEMTRQMLELTAQLKFARQQGDMAKVKMLSDKSKALLAQSDQIEAPEFSQYTQDQVAAGKTGTPLDYLGRSLKSGAEVGSWLMPGAKALGVTSVGGKAGLATLGGGMRGFGSSGYGEALGGTVGGAAVGGGLSLLGSGLKGLATQADKAGENVITKVFKKNQTYNFKDKTGEEMGEFINRHKKDLKGDYFASSVELSKRLQSDFDELARNSGVKIKDGQLKTIFQKEIDRLKSTGLSKNVVTAKKLEKELQGILGNLGKQFDISDLTQARVDADDLTTFGNTKGTRGFYGTVRELEQKTVQNAVKGRTINGRNLEQIGKELNKIYTFKDIARNIKSSNTGGKALSLTNLLSAGGGGIIGGVPGAIAGVAANQALSSPTGTRVISNVLQNAVKPGLNALGSIAGDKLTSQAVIGGMMTPQEEVPQETQLETPNELPTPQTTEPMSTPQVTPPTTPATNGTMETGNLPTPQNKPILSPGGEWQWDSTSKKWTPYKGEATQSTGEQPQTLNKYGYTSTELYRLSEDAYDSGNKALYSKLKEMWGEEKTYEAKIAKDKATAGKSTMTAGQKKELSDFDISSKLMTSLIPEVELAFNKKIIGPVTGRIKKLNPYDTDVQTFNSNIKAVAQNVGRAMEGGVLRKEDIPKYEAMLPQISDTREVALGKIDNVVRMLELQKKIKEQMYSGSENMGDSNADTSANMLNSLEGLSE